MTAVQVPFFSPALGDVNIGTAVYQEQVRPIPFADFVQTSGVPLAASASSSAFGFSRTAGTSFVLSAEATSSSTVTNAAAVFFNLPPTYINGSNITVTVNANYTGSGTIVAASTTIAVAMYTDVNGVETQITGVTAAQEFGSTAKNYTFTVPGTGLTAGALVALQITMVVDSSSGANTGQVNQVSYTA